MKTVFGVLAAVCAVIAVTACERDFMSERGFSLPEGDPIAGKEAFLYMQCNECHTVKGLDLPRLPLGEPYVELGGQVTSVKTYGDLVTSVINPSHRLAQGYPVEDVSEDGESNMYVYNDYMTVQELIDIVMFLQPQYQIVIPRYQYPAYR